MILLTDDEIRGILEVGGTSEDYANELAKAQAKKILDWLDSSSLRVINTKVSADNLFRIHRQIPESAWQQLRQEFPEC